jgi:hypothetical protein
MPEKQSKRFQSDPNYNPWAVSERQDKIGYGDIKADRIARVKENEKFSQLSEEQIQQILKLGAPRHAVFGGDRATQAEKDALRAVAVRHGIKFIPDLNSEPTAQAWIQKKVAQAQAAGDTGALKKLNNLIIDFQDLDNRPETVDNLIIRDRNNSQDIYAIDGLRLTDRNRVAMKRGIYDRFNTKEERSFNKDFIDKVYKKYLKKYLTPEDRARHPFTPEMAVSMDKWIADHESLY